MNCQFLALLNPHVDKGGFSLYFQYKRAGSLPPGGIITSEDLIPEMIVTHDGSQFSATIRDQGRERGKSPFSEDFVMTSRIQPLYNPLERNNRAVYSLDGRVTTIVG